MVTSSDESDATVRFPSTHLSSYTRDRLLYCIHRVQLHNPYSELHFAPSLLSAASHNELQSFYSSLCAVRRIRTLPTATVQPLIVPPVAALPPTASTLPLAIATAVPSPNPATAVAYTCLKANTRAHLWGPADLELTSLSLHPHRSPRHQPDPGRSQPISTRAPSVNPISVLSVGLHVSFPGTRATNSGTGVIISFGPGNEDFVFIQRLGTSDPSNVVRRKPSTLRHVWQG